MSEPISSPRRPAERVRVDGWKAISRRFDVDIKTAQRWESDRGLPVHRIPGGKQGRVFAWEDELSAWMTRSQGSATHRSAGTPVDNSESRAGSANPSSKVSPQIETSPRWRPGRRSALAALASVGLGTAGWFLHRTMSRSRLHGVTIAGQHVVGLGETGAEIWRYRLGYNAATAIAGQNWRARVVEMESTGAVAVVAPFTYGVLPNDEVICLSGHGDLLWRRSANAGLADFNGKPFESGWTVQTFAFSGEPVHTVWIAVTNRVRWASCVLRTTPDGHTGVQFANFGHCQAIAPSVDGKLLFVAGVHNGLDRTCFALVGVDDPPCTAPPGGPPRYAYSNAPPGTVRRYVTAPSTEFNTHLESRPYAHPRQIELGDSVVSVFTDEASEPRVEFIYEFDYNLIPRLVRPGTTCAMAHARLERSKWVTHAWPQCPHACGPAKMDIWELSHGWRVQETPVATSNNLVG